MLWITFALHRVPQFTLVKFIGIKLQTFMSMALRKHKNYMPEDVAEAIIITSLNSDGKRHRGEYNNELYPAKRHATHLVIESADLKDINTAKPDASTSSPPNQNWVLKPAPYFYYTDRSRQPDDEPWTPLTPHGLVPTFPAKVSI